MHAPHQAPRDWIERFRGKFDMGYDQAREVILGQQMEMGIVPKGTRLSARAGFSVTRESPSGEEPTTDSAWAVVGGKYHFFLYNFPKSGRLTARNRISRASTPAVTTETSSVPR